MAPFPRALTMVGRHAEHKEPRPSILTARQAFRQPNRLSARLGPTMSKLPPPQHQTSDPSTQTGPEPGPSADGGGPEDTMPLEYPGWRQSGSRYDFQRIAFRSSKAPKALAAFEEFVRRYGNTPLEDAQVIVAIGGDGFMLETLHQTLHTGLPVFGIHRGTIGFLMNEAHTWTGIDLPRRLADAEPTIIHPLKMVCVDAEETVHRALAINEVSLLRETRQTAKIRIEIDGKERLEELICDGVLVSTPAGSTAYNLSAHGPILPIEARLLALTPISAFRPRRWRGAILPHSAVVRFEMNEPEKRPVSAVADDTEIRHVRSVEVAEDRSVAITILFDKGHNLDERILKEQFYH